VVVHTTEKIAAERSCKSKTYWIY